jgi:cyclin-dependent kinase regulatory subunit CKS1
MDILYSHKYTDDKYEYRHVILPKDLAKMLPPNKLLSEDEWRALGIQQSYGWIHYLIHSPEPHILLFRREKDYIQRYGNVPRESITLVESSMPPENVENKENE